MVSMAGCSECTHTNHPPRDRAGQQALVIIVKGLGLQAVALGAKWALPLPVSEGWDRGEVLLQLSCLVQHLNQEGLCAWPWSSVLGENLSVETGELQNHSKEVGIGLP